MNSYLLYLQLLIEIHRWREYRKHVTTGVPDYYCTLQIQSAFDRDRRDEEIRRRERELAAKGGQP